LKYRLTNLKNKWFVGLDMILEWAYYSSINYVKKSEVSR
jgi:hypothetical protein